MVIALALVLTNLAVTQAAHTGALRIPTDISSLIMYNKCAKLNHVDRRTIDGNLVVVKCMQQSDDIIDATQLMTFLQNQSGNTLAVPNVSVIAFPGDAPEGVGPNNAQEVVSVVYGCSTEYFEQQKSKAETALEISDWRMSGVVMSAGEQASVCFDRLHDVRHAFASIALKNGTSVKEVSELLGHSSPTITLSTYAHTMEGVARTAVNQLASCLFRPAKAA